jgi:hypothetical protein
MLKKVKLANLETNYQGITPKYCIQHASPFSGSLEEINTRILNCLDIKFDDEKAVIDWYTYLKAFCIFKAGFIDKHAHTKFWITFFTYPNNPEITSPREYLDLLEKLCRGKELTKATEESHIFSISFQNMMNLAGCLDEKKNLVITKLEEAFEQDTLDI